MWIISEDIFLYVDLIINQTSSTIQETSDKRVQYPELRNMAHTSSLGMFSKGSNFYILFILTPLSNVLQFYISLRLFCRQINLHKTIIILAL